MNKPRRPADGRRRARPTAAAEPIGIAELARRLGRSERQLRRLATAGKIPRQPDGRFDEATVRDALANTVGVHHARPLKPPTGPQPRPVETRADARAAVSLVREILHEEGRPVSGALTYDDARVVESVLKSRERALRTAERRGSLIDREAANTIAFAFSRQLRDALEAWPARVSPMMGADLGVTAHTLEMTLRRYIRELLTEIAGVDPERLLAALDRIPRKPQS